VWKPSSTAPASPVTPPASSTGSTGPTIVKVSSSSGAALLQQLSSTAAAAGKSAASSSTGAANAATVASSSTGASTANVVASSSTGPSWSASAGVSSTVSSSPGAPSATVSSSTASAPPSTGSLLECGPSVNSICAAGYCCSQWGWCGATTDYCNAQCLSAWGTSGCVATAPIVAPQLPVTGDSAFRVVTTCVEPNTVAFTFDDGPYTNSAAVGQAFADIGARVTFFGQAHKQQQQQLPALLTRVPCIGT